MKRYRIRPVEKKCIRESEFAYIDNKDYGLETTWRWGEFDCFLSDSAAVELSEQVAVHDLKFFCEEANEHADFEVVELIDCCDESFTIDGSEVEHHNKTLIGSEDYDWSIDIECPVKLVELIPVIHITTCDDPLKWYANHLGEEVTLLNIEVDHDEWRVRTPDGTSNYVNKKHGFLKWREE